MRKSAVLLKKCAKNGMTRTKIVLDTNLFVSILLRSASLNRLVELVRVGAVELIVSPAQMAELVDVLHRPKFNFPASDIKILLDWLKAHALFVIPSPASKSICRDPKDDFILLAAETGKADAVVTGDKDLLDLGEYAGIPILTASSFLTKFSL